MKGKSIFTSILLSLFITVVLIEIDFEDLYQTTKQGFLILAYTFIPENLENSSGDIVHYSDNVVLTLIDENGKIKDIRFA